MQKVSKGCDGGKIWSFMTQTWLFRTKQIKHFYYRIIMLSYKYKLKLIDNKIKSLECEKE